MGGERTAVSETFDRTINRIIKGATDLSNKQRNESGQKSVDE